MSKLFPSPDILLIPGGMGTRREMNNPRMLDWLRSSAEGAELVLSVCSGALMLAKAGPLNGLKATTHHGALDEVNIVSRGCSSAVLINSPGLPLVKGLTVIQSLIFASLSIARRVFISRSCTRFVFSCSLMMCFFLHSVRTEISI